MGFVITGANFGATPPSGATVTMDGTLMPIITETWDNYHITVQVPSGMSNGTKSVVVTIAGHASNTVQFRVDSPICDPTSGCSF